MDVVSTSASPSPNAAQDAKEFDWEQFVARSKQSISRGTTARRIETLDALAQQVRSRDLISPARAQDIVRLLLLALPFPDGRTRHLSLDILRLVLEAAHTSDEQHAGGALVAGLVRWIETEAHNAEKGGAASPRFVALSWACTACQTWPVAPENAQSVLWTSLVTSVAKLLFCLLDPRRNVKPALRRATLSVTRRAVRATPTSVPHLVRFLATTPAEPGYRNAPLLGLIMDVTLRLKTSKKGIDTAALLHDVKDVVDNFFIDRLVNAKSVPPAHALHAFQDYLAATSDVDHIQSSLMPALEASLSKTPAVGLSVLSTLLTSLPSSAAFSPRLRLKLLPLVLGPTKLALQSTRDAAVRIASSLVIEAGLNGADAEELRKATIDLVCSPLRAGKTSSPEHRAALYTILASSTPSDALSLDVVATALSALPKESNEAAVRALLRAVSTHLPHLLQNGIEPAPAHIGALAKAMQETKSSTRRAAHIAAGSVLWAVPNTGERSDAAASFALGILPGIESALKLMGSNPVNAPSGPLEGYVAVAVLETRLRHWGIGKIDEFVEANATMRALLSTGPKPSFLLWDKVYRKATTAEDELWLSRAIAAVFAQEGPRLAKDASLQSSVFQPLAHLVVTSESFETRAAVAAAFGAMQRHDPELLNQVVRIGLRHWLLNKEASVAAALAKASVEDGNARLDQSTRLRTVLVKLADIGDDVDPARREHLLVQLVVLAHHPQIAPLRAGVWVDMLLRAGLAPERVIEGCEDELFELVFNDASTLPANDAFAEAAFAAARSLALICPSLVVPRLFRQFKDDLDTAHLHFIGNVEYGVWATPEGTAFVDVLNASKPKQPTLAKNSKEREIEIWEAELRDALARKKPQASSISKADAHLLQRQLEKEAEIRWRMRHALGRLRRGFQLSLVLVTSGAENVKEYLASMINDVLSVITTRPATLVAEAAFATYLRLGRVCSPRLGSFQTALAVAVLRGLDAEVVPINFHAEPLCALATRVLYRLRFLAEEAPFDAGTFAYAAPLVSQTVRSGGIGLDRTSADAALEQVTLALDFLAFHARSCSETAFPRLAMIEDILAVLSTHPTLARTATAALADVCDSLKDNAAPSEIELVLKGILTDEASIRFACLQAIQPLDLTDLVFPASLWVACHDSELRNRQLAVNAWQENALDVPETFLADLLPLLGHPASAIRSATARAIAAGIAVHPSLLDDTIRALVAEYQDKAKEVVPLYDQFGMIIESSLTAEDPWRARQALASTLRLAAPSYAPEHVQALFDLLIEGAALGDRKQAVRSEMLEAAIGVIDLHGTANLHALISRFEDFLRRPSSGDDTQDYIVESLVILFGRIARHLEPTDPRIMTVVARLIDALRTPSEVVQAAVCDCLSPLAHIISEDVPGIIGQLMDDLFAAEKYAERRGAAFGLAGMVRGRGISALKEFSVLGRLRDNAEDKKSVHARQGAVFAYEIFSTVLGRLFEPYVTEILPVLLACFGDTAREVRDATQDAAKAIMSQLSGHAVKLMLPTLLEGLDERQWRAKKGAIEMMGAMAFLAPRQLSLSLPTILPRLTEVLTDTHKQVREAANASLMRFGEVVTNPEIQAMTRTLLDALVDPAGKTPKALDALLSTTFAHFIDSSSLALVIPILERGLRERSADVKRKAAALVGNMATITESRDLTPYLPQLVPLLREVLIDPVPEARSTSAKSLGALVERLGEASFPDLVDSLMSVLKSPSSGVDQQGAAQGLAEVLQACGIDRLEGLLPTILANTSHPRTYVREGHSSLLIFLPVTFGDRFSPYLGRIIQPVLNGLADDSDYVRDASMRAGRMIVSNHSTKAIDLLLPELETGLFDPSWRIRHSSVQLVGELLFRISGVSGKPDMDDEADEDADEPALGSDAARKALLDALGREKRDRVLSGLYIVRQDSVGVVRQAALHVWKALVSNTPRTVREVLPVLMQIVVRILAAPGAEQRATAATTLAETCRKLGEAVLGEVITNLRKAMASPERRQREGVCLALTELMANTTKSSLEAHEGAVIEAVRNALVDPEPSVRTAAAKAFDMAQQVIGPRSIDQTIPTLLDALQQPGDTADAALAALKEVMQVRAEKIFPVLIPRLIAPPITAFNARALASLVRVAGHALGRRLTRIVDALQDARSSETDVSTLVSLDEALSAVLSSVHDHESGLGSLLIHMLSLAKAESPAKRVIGCNLFTRFCQVTHADFDDFRVDWVRQLVSSLDDRSPEVVDAAWEALDALVKTISKEDMEVLVVPLRRTVESVGTPGVSVEGFSRANGLKPLLPIFLQGLLAGTGEQREYAAYGLGDLVERTDPAAFKPYTIQVVGPLIRVIGDRFPPPVKSAILSTLTILLHRVQQFVKPFFPQLQRTFIKSLTDASSLSVRNRGVVALGVLMKHQPRVDAVVTELVNLAGTESGETRDSVVNGLASVVTSGGKHMTEAPRAACIDLVSEAFSEHGKESYNTAIARLLAALAQHDPESIDFLVRSFLLGDLPPTQLASLSIRELVDTAPHVLYDLDASTTAERVIRNSASGMAPAIARPARETKELMRERAPWCEDEELLSRFG